MSQILDKISFNTKGGEYILRSVETLPVSYSDLVSIRNNGELVPGMWYRITDYSTRSSKYTCAGHPFLILVQALTENTLSEDAKAYADKIDFKYVEYLLLYLLLGEDENYVTDTYNRSNSPTVFNHSEEGTPSTTFDLTDSSIYLSNGRGYFLRYGFRWYFPDQDLFWNNFDCAQGKGYFNHSNLSAWELKYCLDNDTFRFSWASEDGLGVIYYMKDEFGNEAGYDFKNILIDGLYTFGPDLDYSMSGDIYQVYNNKIAPSRILPVSDDSVSIFAASAATSIVIGSDHSQTNLQCYDYLTIPCHTFTSHCYNITVGPDSYGNKFIGNGSTPCYNVVLGCNSLLNTVLYTKNIQIGHSCFNNCFSKSDSLVFGNSNMNFVIINSNNIVVGNYNLIENIKFNSASGSYIGNHNVLKSSSTESVLSEVCHIGSFNSCTFGQGVQQILNIGDNNQLTCDYPTISLCIGNNNISCYIGTGSFLQCSIGDNTSNIKLNGALKFCRVESNCSNITVSMDSTAINTVFKAAFNEYEKTHKLTDLIYLNNNLKEIY